MDAGSDQSILGHRQMDSPSQMTHTESGEFTDFSSPNLLVFESGGAHQKLHTECLLAQSGLEPTTFGDNATLLV